MQFGDLRPLDPIEDAIASLTAKNAEQDAAIASLTAQIANLYRIPAGSVFMFAGNTAPSGFLKCNGLLHSRAAYPDLWAAAQSSGMLVSEAVWQTSPPGNPYQNKGFYSSGNDSSTFRVPDSRGMFIRAWDDGRGVDVGRAIGNGQLDGVREHRHAGLYNSPASNGYNYPFGVGSVSPAGGVGAFPVSPSSAPGPHNGNTENAIHTGLTVGASPDTRPRNIALLFVIKF